MTSTGLLIVGLVILAGLVGIVLPVLPGAILVLGAILVWAYEVGTTTSWVVFAVAALVIAVVAFREGLGSWRGESCCEDC